MPAHVSLATACALATGCGSNAAENGHRFTVTEEDGVTVARTTGGPKYEGELFRYELVYEVQQDPAIPESLFWEPLRMTLDEELNLYVLDRGHRRVLVFDDQGRYRYGIASPGEGPGELQFPTALELRGDRLHVGDVMHRARFTYELDGTYVGLDRWPAIERGGSVLPRYWWRDDGGVVIWNVTEERDNDGTERWRAEMIVRDADGAETGRAVTDWARWNQRIDEHSVPVHFAPWPWGGYVPGRGIWTTSGQEPVVRWYDLQGRETERWEAELPVRPLTAQDRAAVEEVARARLETAQQSGSDFMLRRMRAIASNTLYFEPKPFWGTGMIDDRGYGWMAREELWSAPESIPASYVVFSPEGELLGITRTEAKANVRHGHLVRFVDPTAEEPIPAVYRIVPLFEELRYGE